MLEEEDNNPELSTKDRVLRLIEKKIKLENELQAQHDILRANNTDMMEHLVDNQGFPRNDIDVYQVRHARQMIHCIQNDLRDLFKQIEEGLFAVHNAEATVEPTRLMANVNLNENSVHADNVPRTPFAYVSMVDNGSPADLAGLCQDDKIIQFGSLTHANFTCMDEINSIVSHSVGQRINVQVMRGQLVVGVTLVPRPWQNRGLLGCRIQMV